MQLKNIYFSILIVGVFSSEIPEYLKDKRCSMKKDFSTCLIKNGNLAIPIVAKGDPDYHIPNLIPMELPFIQLISTQTLSLNMTKVRIHGLDKTVIVDNKINLEQNIFTLTLKNANITIEGDYVVSGKVMVLPIEGNGQFSILLKNGAYKVTSIANAVEVNGEKYLKPTGTRLNYQFDKVVFQFDNLFEGNKKLGDQVNTFLNENWDLLLDDFGPGIAATISTIIEDIFEKFASKISFKNFFKD